MGNVTDIQHIASSSPMVYELGDQQFDIGTVLRSNRGWPGKVIDCHRNDYLKKFGIPSRTSEDGYQAYFALHNHENTLGRYVRVVSATAEYPYYTYSDTGVLTLASATFDTEVTPAGAIEMVFILKNGEVRDNFYGFKISDLDAVEETFVITVYENSSNPVQVGEAMTVSLTESAIAADGSSLFAEAVLEAKSDVLGIKVKDGALFTNVAAKDTVWFSGGNDTATPSAQDYADAWALLKDQQINIDHIFTAGDVTDANIVEAAAVADERDIMCDISAAAGLTVAAAITWVEGLGVQSQNLAFYYGSVSFNDPFYTGMRKTLGLSGFATACMAYSRNASRTIVDPGIEEAPAGERFGLIRGVTGIRNETVLSKQDKIDLAAAWINYVVNSSNAGVIFWEQFTYYGKDCTWAYKRNVNVINYIYHVHEKLMQSMQFRGKSDREIINEVSKVLQRLKTKEVLVADETHETFPEAFKVWITRSGSTVEVNRAIRIQNAIGPVILRSIPY